MSSFNVQTASKAYFFAIPTPQKDHTFLIAVDTNLVDSLPFYLRIHFNKEQKTMGSLYKTLLLALVTAISSEILANSPAKSKQIKLVTTKYSIHRENPLIIVRPVTHDGKLTISGSKFHSKTPRDLNIYANGKLLKTVHFKGLFSVTLSPISVEDSVKISVVDFYGPGKHLKQTIYLEGPLPAPEPKSGMSNGKKAAIVTGAALIGAAAGMGYGLGVFYRAGAFK